MQSRHLVLATAILGSALCAQTNPVPLVDNPLSPSSAAPGSPGFTLTVNGTGFRANSVVKWNGNGRATAFVSQSQLTATILASDVAAAGTAAIKVVNPAPGGGTSNVAFFQVTGPTVAVALATASTYALPANSIPVAVASGDLNGDGKLDLVVADWNAVDVLLGNGDGTFQPPARFDLASPTESVVIGDFNNDGIPDLALDSCCGAVFVLLGNGDGTFQPYRSFSTDADQYGNGITAGDLNGDGNLDLAAAGYANVGILLGDGNGTFGSNNYLIDRFVYALVTGDFNGDGNLDLAVAGGGGINIMLGTGNGSFQTPTHIPGDYYSLVAADFNGDGNLDIAASGSKGVTVLFGGGDGHFTGGGSYPVYSTSSVIGNLGPLVAGDFNGDGKLDVAVSVGGGGVGAISILFGNGDGSFQPPQTTAGQWGPFSLAAGDFNGDGRLDVAALEYPPYPAQPAVAINLQTTALVSPGALSFAPATVKTTSQPKTVTVTNLGTAPLNIAQIGLSGTNAAEFALSSDTCQGAAVPPSGNCTVGVTFSPAAAGARTALLSVSDNASVSPQVAAIAGNGTVITLTPEKLDFGDVKVGTISPRKAIVATNTSSSVVDISGISIVGDPHGFLESNTCGTFLNPKTTCSIVIQFVPARTGPQKAGVSFTAGTDADPQEVALSGTGT